MRRAIYSTNTVGRDPLARLNVETIMRKTILLSAAGAIILGLAGPAAANQSSARTQQPADANSAAAANPNRTICVREAITGSRMERRVCRTAREWQDQEGGLPEGR